MGKLLSALVILALLSVFAIAAEQRPVKPSVGAQPGGATQPQPGTLLNPQPGDAFRDCPVCPEMVVVPAGGFKMGSPPGERGREASEGPRHIVRIPVPFAVGRYEVTFAEWDACVADGGCGGYLPMDWGWGRGDRPVVGVDWERTQDYIRWLSRKTGMPYRLLTEAEWEYAARAGTGKAYSWGNAIGKGNANCDGCGGNWDNQQTAPVGSFSPNRFGLHDMHGNVWEWVEDRWNPSYGGAPTDGSEWTTTGDPNFRILRGGAWFNAPMYLRSAYRGHAIPTASANGGGFRVARHL